MADTVDEIVKSMNDSDIYSAMLGFLYELHEIPQFSLLSELIYMVNDKESFLNILEGFAGKTVRFPTEEELADSLQVLKLYHFYENEHRTWKDSVKLAGFDSSSGKLATNKLNALKETIKKYNYGNRSY